MSQDNNDAEATEQRRVTFSCDTKEEDANRSRKKKAGKSEKMAQSIVEVHFNGPYQTELVPRAGGGMILKLSGPVIEVHTLIQQHRNLGNSPSSSDDSQATAAKTSDGSSEGSFPNLDHGGMSTDQESTSR